MGSAKWDEAVSMGVNLSKRANHTRLSPATHPPNPSNIATLFFSHLTQCSAFFEPLFALLARCCLAFSLGDGALTLSLVHVQV